MTDYIDLVIVKMKNGKKYLFQAPEFSRLEAGDKVICNTKNGDQDGTVVDVMIEQTDSDDCRFVKNLAGVDGELAKIKTKVIYQEFAYEDEDETDPQEG